MPRPSSSRWWLAAGLALSMALPGCAVPAREARASPSLCVVSWNIRHGAGMDGVVDLDRTAATLRSLAPDLIALQEVDAGVRRSGGIDQAAALGEALGMTPTFASFMDYQGGRYGLAILSRLPIRSQRTIPLPPGDEPRAALLVEVELENGEVVACVCVHFHALADDAVRYEQARTLCTILDALPLPWIVAGDCNDVPGSRTRQLFAERTRSAAKPVGGNLTFPASAPIKEIDLIEAAPPSRWDVSEVRVVDERMASDHRPVVAVLTLLGDAPRVRGGRATRR
jgi:endonuclease/exonuclease/phosphatase family metal-dependent hydrolase